MPGQEREHPTRRHQMPGHRLHIQQLTIEDRDTLHESSVPTQPPPGRDRHPLIQRSPSCFAVADRMPYSNAAQLRERCCEVTKALELGTHNEIRRGFSLLDRRSRTTRAVLLPRSRLYGAPPPGTPPPSDPGSIAGWTPPPSSDVARPPAWIGHAFGQRGGSLLARGVRDPRLGRGAPDLLDEAPNQAASAVSCDTRRLCHETGHLRLRWISPYRMPCKAVLVFGARPSRQSANGR